MIYKWVKIDITQEDNITEAGTFTIATPMAGCWISVVKMFLSPLFSNFENHEADVQILFDTDEKTGNMNLDLPLNIDLSQYHEVLSGEVNEALKIKTTCSSLQGYVLISETEE